MHKQFLLAALEQAYLGRGMCAPNPSVGAVAVQHGNIIAQSWHHGAGTSHAEILLLDLLPEYCADVTMYVTLEPCNHWGRTPPCVDAIIQRGIKSVVYAYADPNPVVSVNNTPALLTQHGIAVLHYPLPEIDRFYQSYRHWTLTHTPWVTAKIAQTLDGKIGRPQARTLLSNTLCADFTHKNRQYSDLILTTAQTINQDNPLLNVRILSGEVIAKPVAIIDRQLRLNPQAFVLSSASHCYIYYDEDLQPSPSHQRANCSYHAMPLDGHGLDLAAVMNHLGALGYHDVWVEAGSLLFNALHRAVLVNRTYVYLVPTILGSSAIPAWRDTSVFNRPYALRWHAMGDNMIAQFDWQEDGCLPD